MRACVCIGVHAYVSVFIHVQLIESSAAVVLKEGDDQWSENHTSPFSLAVSIIDYSFRGEKMGPRSLDSLGVTERGCQQAEWHPCSNKQDQLGGTFGAVTKEGHRGGESPLSGERALLGRGRLHSTLQVPASFLLFRRPTPNSQPCPHTPFPPGGSGWTGDCYSPFLLLQVSAFLSAWSPQRRLLHAAPWPVLRVGVDGLPCLTNVSGSEYSSK